MDKFSGIIENVGVFAAVLTTIVALIIRLYNVIHNKMKYNKLSSYSHYQSTKHTRKYDISNLLSELNTIKGKIDYALNSLHKDIITRQKVLSNLIERNVLLEEEEQKLKERISKLKDTPIEVAEYFKSITDQNLMNYEKRSGKRDILMFILGIISTTIVSVIITILFT